MTGRYKAYPEYKSTDEVWLGDVPSHWRVLKINRLTIVKRGASPRPIDDPKYFDESGEYAWVRIADVTASDTYLANTTQRLSPLGASLSVKLEPDELFLSIAGTVGKPCINKIKACIHDGFVYFPEYKENTKFLFYIFAAGEAYKGLGKFGTQLNLNTETVGGIKIGIPCIEEQHKIVNFLDHETAKIDTLITKQEKLIELLKEKRQAVISHAVTKGLNPDAPMKDSGVEWLGEVPEHWDIYRSKRLFPESKNRAPISDMQLSATQDYGVISQKKFMKLAGRKVVQLNSNQELRKKVHVGDFVISMRSFQGGLERAWEEGGIRSSYVVLQPSELVNKDYFQYLFKSVRYIQAIQSTANFIRDGQDMNYQNFILIDLPLPSLEEQKHIASFIRDHINQVDSLIEKAQKAILLMQERKTALISAVVTGKVDVRDWQQQGVQG
ncbi:restriction endonuclease subunit S [Vibrio parahaemolyticus O1]|nr:restriction endonuclease subunit S [Vibrio parahaemolyticus O1]